MAQNDNKVAQIAAEPPKTIGYNQVSFSLEKGMKARRKGWDKGVEIFGQAPVIYCGASPWHPSKEDMRATDWEIYK